MKDSAFEIGQLIAVKEWNAQEIESITQSAFWCAVGEYLVGREIVELPPTRARWIEALIAVADFNRTVLTDSSGRPSSLRAAG